MTYISGFQQNIHLVSGAQLPGEVLISYKDDTEQTKLSIRGLWQALRIYQQCWLDAEPLENGSDIYKCRFSASRDFLYPKDPSANEGSAFLYLLSFKQVSEILHAPITPIEWQIVTDEQGNEYPINIFGRKKSLGQTAPKEVEFKGAAPSNRAAQDILDSQQKQEIAPASTSSLEEKKPKDLTTYKERKSEDPIATYYEQISLATIDAAVEALYPGFLATGQRPPRKYIPLILIKAMSFTLAQDLEHERDPEQCRLIQQHIEDMELMIEKERMWYWDRERYVTVLWTDELSAVCAVNVGIHPRIRAKDQKEASHRATKGYRAKRSA